MIAAVLIGAHAVGEAEQLLKRDPGFWNAYFAGRDVVDPTTVDTDPRR